MTDDAATIICAVVFYVSMAVLIESIETWRDGRKK